MVQLFVTVLCDGLNSNEVDICFTVGHVRTNLNLEPWCQWAPRLGIHKYSQYSFMLVYLLYPFFKCWHLLVAFFTHYTLQCLFNDNQHHSWMHTFLWFICYFSRHKQSFSLLIPITHVCRPYIPFYSEYINHGPKRD